MHASRPTVSGAIASCTQVQAEAGKAAVPAAQTDNGVAQTSDAPVLRLGIYFNAKKRAQFLRPLFTQSDYCVPHPIGGGDVLVRIVVIETPDDLDTHGPFDILLLKLTDLMTCARYSTDRPARRAARDSLQRVQQFIDRSQARGVLAVIEPLEHVERVLNRAAIQALVQQLHIRCNIHESSTSRRDSVACAIPSAFLYQQKAEHAACGAKLPPVVPASPATGNLPVLSALPTHMRFPVICKTVAACGSADSHRMYILQRPEEFALMHAHAHAIQSQQAGTAAPASIPSSHPVAPEPVAAASSHLSSGVVPSRSPSPAVLAAPPVWLMQQYVNHGAVIYKVYVLDDEIQIVAKVSLHSCRSCKAGVGFHQCS